MHRLVEQNLEQVLHNADAVPAAKAHLSECAECREEIAGMREHATLFRKLRPPAEDLEPRPGFYARVLERIEAQTPVSIWNLVFESAFGRRIAAASLALAVLMGVFLVSAEQQPTEPVAVVETLQEAIEVLPVTTLSGQFVALHDNAGVMMPGEPNSDSVLANLVTYREQ